MSFRPYGHKQRGLFYRVIDEYTLFYLRWIEKAKDGLIKAQSENNFWKNQYKSPAWHSWSGYAFEAVCYKHIDTIIKALKITDSCLASAWRYVPHKKEDQGAQIDLVLDRQDGSITICEIKYTEQPFEVNKSIAKNLQTKLETFQQVTKTDKQILVALISANGIKDTMYSDELISGVVTANELITIY